MIHTIRQLHHCISRTKTATQLIYKMGPERSIKPCLRQYTGKDLLQEQSFQTNQIRCLIPEIDFLAETENPYQCYYFDSRNQKLNLDPSHHGLMSLRGSFILNGIPIVSQEYLVFENQKRTEIIATNMKAILLQIDLNKI